MQFSFIFLLSKFSLCCSNTTEKSTEVFRREKKKAKLTLAPSHSHRHHHHVRRSWLFFFFFSLLRWSLQMSEISSRHHPPSHRRVVFWNIQTIISLSDMRERLDGKVANGINEFRARIFKVCKGKWEWRKKKEERKKEALEKQIFFTSRCHNIWKVTNLLRRSSSREDLTHFHSYTIYLDTYTQE